MVINTILKVHFSYLADFEEHRTVITSTNPNPNPGGLLSTSTYRNARPIFLDVKSTRFHIFGSEISDG